MEVGNARRHGLTHWGYIILVAVKDRPGTNQADLAKAIGHDKNRIVRDIDALEKEGLLRRTPDPADRRANRLHLTRTGRRRAVEAQADLHKQEDLYLSSLATSQQVAFIETLRTLASARRPD
ncbi:MarR family winged helix-turn-helix transcriptional regulator [Planomonospora sp. ID67723]|uniref:MarR family winged helix-turn-helix transcriptional regulator n=1 Tax=Planomonospora sp. ID67723 TaxID=2738134 RepID=UPI001E470D4E|nr:MarR family transcriptional regulator [Planomonospora sp. ID67723]